MLAGLARRTMKAKHNDLVEALDGMFDDHHGELLIWHLLAAPEARCTDLGYGYHQARTDTNRRLRNHIRQIQAPAYNVTVIQAA